MLFLPGAFNISEKNIRFEWRGLFKITQMKPTFSKISLVFTLFLLALLFGCKESQKTNPAKLTPPQTKLNQSSQQAQTGKEQKIIQILKNTDLSRFPSVVELYFRGNQNIQIAYLDNTTLKLISKLDNNNLSVVQIHLLDSQNNNHIIFINATKRDSLLYSNYYYVLSVFKNKTQNITLYVVPEEIPQILKLELGTEFHYQKLGNFWAYITENTHYLLDFNFFGNVCFVQKCFLSAQNHKQNCKKIVKLTWTGNKFAFKLIDYKRNSNLLTSEQLDKVKRYTNLDVALANPSKVYILDLDGKGISKLPPDIKYLKKLQILILSNNNLDSLPEEIGELSNLQILRAENNNIAYIPKSLGFLYYLEELNLANNRLNWIPYEFANLKNLEKLNVSGNELDVLAFDMSNLQNLYSINLSKNKFEKIPYQIFKLKHLIYLDLSNNPVKVLPRELIDMHSLQYLVIKNTLIDTNQIKYLKLKRQDLQIIY